jgi:hypothetical protein
MIKFTEQQIENIFATIVEIFEEQNDIKITYELINKK